jgi:hypothetical protein
MPLEVLCRLEMNLQLIGRLDGRLYDIDLQPGVAGFVQVHPDHQHHTVGQLDPKLAPVGPKRGTGDRMTPEHRQALGDAPKVVQRNRSHWRAGHSAAPRSKSIDNRVAPWRDAGRSQLLTRA